MEIMFTVFSAFEFVENPFREWTEALGTSKKKVENDYFLVCFYLLQKKKMMQNLAYSLKPLCFWEVFFGRND